MRILFLFILIDCVIMTAFAQPKGLPFFKADNDNIQYTGRIDFTNPILPRFWNAGVYFETKFSGSYCELWLNDEELWGKNHNYLEVVVDGKPVRLQTTGKENRIVVANGLPDGEHTLLVCKNTEANIGYLELVGITCKALLKPAPRPKRKIECFGNSITCGASSDESAIPCGKGVWQDQHNAYLAYGPTMARTLNAQYHLTSVSGIGLIHSCCNMKLVMPQVYDKICLSENKLPWGFSAYQPNVVTICLGQNDGIQDSATFCNAYINFIDTLEKQYPKATFICLSSPMADASLLAFTKKMLPAIVGQAKKKYGKKIRTYYFNKQYHMGCDSHPSIQEHQEIAAELTKFVRKVMKW